MVLVELFSRIFRIHIRKQFSGSDPEAKNNSINMYTVPYKELGNASVDYYNLQYKN
jgi:hypothetical protein